MKMKNEKLRGFTLTEAAIVLGIVGLILGAIWVAAASVYNNMRVNTSKRQYLTIAQNIRTLHATQNTIANATIPQWITAGIFPGDMVAGTAARDVWTGAVAITQETSPAGILGDAFGIQFSRIPQAACVDLLVSMTGQGRDAGLIGAQGGTATMPTGTPATTNSLAALTAITAGAQCTGAAGNNFVKFTFRLKG